MASRPRRTPTGTLGTGSASTDVIRLKGVRVHNLRGIDVEIPRNKLTVVTGVSGSGKSSLAFDTLYAEGRRRYVACLSTYLQQFLDRMPRPELERVGHLPPAIALERAVPAAQARSTVGTTTEIHDYLRLLFARIGRTFCIECGRPVSKEPVGLVARELVREGGRGFIAFEVDSPRNRRLWPAFRRELERDGFMRICGGDEMIPVCEAKWKAGTVQVVVDRLVFESSKGKQCWRCIGVPDSRPQVQPHGISTTCQPSGDPCCIAVDLKQAHECAQESCSVCEYP